LPGYVSYHLLTTLLLWLPYTVIAYTRENVMNAIPTMRPKPFVGSRIFVTIVFSMLAGSHLEKASLHYSVPRQPYERTGDLLVGIAFLIAVIAHALRLTRDITSMLKEGDELPD